MHRPFGGENTVTDIKLVATDNTPATTALRRDDRQLEDRWNLPSSVSAAPTLNQRAEIIPSSGFLKRHFCFEFFPAGKQPAFNRIHAAGPAMTDRVARMNMRMNITG
jgi:hypothetical protein